MLMIAHRLSTVTNADFIYVVQDGQIAEFGTKDELCTQNRSVCWDVAGDYQASVRWGGRKGGVKMIGKIQHATASSPEAQRSL